VKRDMRSEPKELSSREKAKLFAKNIPKPKVKRQTGELEEYSRDPNMLTQVVENPDDENAHTMT
jgi:hypothetical protein